MAAAGRLRARTPVHPQAAAVKIYAGRSPGLAQMARTELGYSDSEFSATVGWCSYSWPLVRLGRWHCSLKLTPWTRSGHRDPSSSFCCLLLGSFTTQVCIVKVLDTPLKFVNLWAVLTFQH